MRIPIVPRLSGLSTRVVVGVICTSLAGCAARQPSPPLPLPPSAPAAKITVLRMQVPKRGQLPELLGRMQRHSIQPKETLLDVARDAGLGFNEVKDANPNVDEWIPPAGLEVAVPTHWVPP